MNELCVGEADSLPSNLSRSSTLALSALLAGIVELTEREVIGSWAAFQRYILTSLHRSPTEHTRALFLDRKNGLISDELLVNSPVAHATFNPREIACKALKLNAAAVILVCIQPTGDVAPSAADIATTRNVAAALATIGVALHDHAIVSRNHVFSMRNAKHF